jgi:hypothetical protein
MVTAEQADAAKDGLQGEIIEGRTLSIEKARHSRPRTPTSGKYFGPPLPNSLVVSSYWNVTEQADFPATLAQTGKLLRTS